MAFSDRLKDLRLEKCMDQTELGKIFNLSKQSISAYEKGKGLPNPETFEKIADYFGVTTDYLFGRTNNKNIPIESTYTITKTSSELELLEVTKKLTPRQFEAILIVARSMSETSATEKDLAVKPELDIDPISKLPYWHLRLKALRKERGLTIEEAAEGIASISDNHLTADVLEAYESGRIEMEPSDHASATSFYNVSWAFMTGRTNIRRGYAGVLPTMEAASRTDDPTQPLPPEAQKSLNNFYKDHGLYYGEGDGGEKG